MITPLSIVALGFFLGMRHATDADHVIAVTTIVGRQRSLRPAAWIGALWGIGHTLTIVLVGAAIVLFNVSISERVGLFLELAVGLMLIGLGLSSVLGWASAVSASRDHTRAAAANAHAHRHGDYIHSHVHGNEQERHPHDPDDTPLARLDRSFNGLAWYQVLRPLIVGVVHGLAGSAAVALLVLATIRDPQWAIVYLLVFGLGTVAGMVVLTTVVALPFVYTSGRFSIANRGLQVASGVLSLAFGVLMASQIVMALAK